MLPNGTRDYNRHSGFWFNTEKAGCYTCNKTEKFRVNSSSNVDGTCVNCVDNFT